MPTTATITRPTHTTGDEIDAATYNNETVIAVTVPDATLLAPGVIQLAGDLEGSATAPVIKQSVLSTFMRTVTATANAIAARLALGLGDAATKNTGSAAGTLCAGDDARLSDARQCNNTFANAAASRTALELGDAATKNTGSAAGTVCAGNDARLSDARPPLSHGHAAGDISGLGALAAKSAINNGDWSGSALSLANGGLGATTVLPQQAVWGLHDGTKLHSTPNGITVADADASAQLFLGQSAARGLVYQWTYAADPATAYALIATYSKGNQLIFQAKDFRFDTTSLDFALQAFASGRVRVGGGSDDGVNALQAPSMGVTALNYTNARPVITTLSYSATTDLDLTAADEQTITLAGNITFTTSNRATSRVKGLRIIGDGSSRTLAWPAGWKWLGPVPTSLAAGKTARLSLVCYGPADTDIVAAYTAEL